MRHRLSLPCKHSGLSLLPAVKKLNQAKQTLPTEQRKVWIDSVQGRLPCIRILRLVVGLEVQARTFHTQAQAKLFRAALQ